MKGNTPGSTLAKQVSKYRQITPHAMHSRGQGHPVDRGLLSF